MTKRFEGIYPPAITSFTEDGEIYEKGIRNVIRYLMSEGVHGFFINGSYGSCVLMTIEERKRVAEIIHDEVSGRLPIITHVGEASTRATIELAKHAEDLARWRWRPLLLIIIPEQTPTMRARSSAITPILRHRSVCRHSYTTIPRQAATH